MAKLVFMPCSCCCVLATCVGCLTLVRGMRAVVPRRLWLVLALPLRTARLSPILARAAAAIVDRHCSSLTPSCVARAVTSRRPWLLLRPPPLRAACPVFSLAHLSVTAVRCRGVFVPCCAFLPCCLRPHALTCSLSPSFVFPGVRPGVSALSQLRLAARHAPALVLLGCLRPAPCSCPPCYAFPSYLRLGLGLHALSASSASCPLASCRPLRPGRGWSRPFPTRCCSLVAPACAAPPHVLSPSHSPSLTICLPRPSLCTTRHRGASLHVFIRRIAACVDYAVLALLPARIRLHTTAKKCYLIAI